MSGDQSLPPLRDGQRVEFDPGDGRRATGTVLTVRPPADEPGYPTRTPPTAAGGWWVLVQPDSDEESVVVSARDCHSL